MTNTVRRAGQDANAAASCSQSSRLLTPDAETWVEAGLIAGTLARTQGFQPHQRKDCLNDALVLLTAAKAGLAVLARNRGEFDLIQQLAPECRFLYYQDSSPTAG